MSEEKKEERMIEFVAKEVKGDELLGFIWADSLLPAELKALGLPAEQPVDAQLPFSATYSLEWDDNLPLPCLEGVTVFSPAKPLSLDVGEERADFDALQDDIELLADQALWLEERAGHMIDNAQDSREDR